jgi:hypothetical protein
MAPLGAVRALVLENWLSETKHVRELLEKKIE